MNVKFQILFFSILIISCNNEKELGVIWQKNIPTIGSQSSPRATDLNSDDILDIVIGAGENEYDESDQGVLAIDGLTGDIIWQAPCKDQMFGSPTFIDINLDNTEDIIIGGRSGELYGLNGINGDRLWQYDPEKYFTHPVLKYADKNFYNGVLVPDCNGDGIKDILISNGGDPEIMPYQKQGRKPGLLLILDTKTGDIIAADTMPDGNETYMSPIYVEQKDGSNVIVFGTGGETISGNLYITRLEDLLNNDLSKSTLIAAENAHGFIAPPALVDINNDNVFDIIAISHAGTMFAFDGQNLKDIWQFKIPNTDSSTGLAIGNFNGDDIPDIFTVVNNGQYPWNTISYQIMLNGLTGKLEYIDSIGCAGFASPIVYDLNNDEIDEVVISLNLFDCTGFSSAPPKNMQSKIVAINFKNKEIIPIDQDDQSKNIFTTPLLADIDGDGYLDITHCTYPHTSNLPVLINSGINVKRITTPFEVTKPIKWGAYMGSNGDGTYR